ncbi:hypothetical protein BH18ACT7_BH18ACT7_14180 [soil metagenome]
MTEPVGPKEAIVSEKITVSVDDEHVERIDEVVDRLRAAGMRVEQVLRPIGLVTGSVETPDRERLSTLAGVAAVEPQRRMQLPPPDADIQ